MTIIYIRGKDNMVVDVLSHIAPNSFPDEMVLPASVNTILSITSNYDILTTIKSGYKEDAFCKKVTSTEMKGWTKTNGLWYIVDHLLLPCVNNVCELLFHLAHDTLGHFGVDKSYMFLTHCLS